MVGDNFTTAESAFVFIFFLLLIRGHTMSRRGFVKTGFFHLAGNKDIKKSKKNPFQTGSSRKRFFSTYINKHFWDPRSSRSSPNFSNFMTDSGFFFCYRIPLTPHSEVCDLFPLLCHTRSTYWNFSPKKNYNDQWSDGHFFLNIWNTFSPKSFWPEFWWNFSRAPVNSFFCFWYDVSFGSSAWVQVQ